MNSKHITSIALFGLAGAMGAQAKLLVYEPFAYPDGSLTGQGGALGTEGTWTSFESLHPAEGWRVHQEGDTSGIVVAPGPPVVRNMFDGTVANLPTSGGYVGLPGPEDVGEPDLDRDFEIGRYSDASIALDPGVTSSFQAGTVTWFSYVTAHAWDRNEEAANLTIGTDPTPNESRSQTLTNSGNGISSAGGPPRDNRVDILPKYFSEGVCYNVLGAVTAFSQASVPDATGTMPWVRDNPDGSFGAPNIVVGKIEWDADTGGEDIISVVGFLQTDTLSEDAFEALIALKPDLSSANWAANKPDLDQSEFDTLNISGNKFFVDEIRIGTTFDDVIKGGVAPDVPFQLTISNNGPNLDIEWDSNPGMFYNVRSNTELDADLSSWDLVEVEGVTDLATTPPANMHTIARPGDPVRFYRVEEFPLPPVTVFSDDFESGIGSWTTGSDGAAGTEWQLGQPSIVGPGEANSPLNCFGTNISADYGTDSNIWLRSPEIDLTLASEATLRYAQFKDIEQGFDFGIVVVLDAADDSQLAVIEALVDGVTADWGQFSKAIPAEALGRIIKLEFRFESDDISNFAGWYIDDLVVTTPAP